MEKQPGKFFFSIVDFQLFDPIEVAILENTKERGTKFIYGFGHARRRMVATARHEGGRRGEVIAIDREVNLVQQQISQDGRSIFP